MFFEIIHLYSLFVSLFMIHIHPIPINSHNILPHRHIITPSNRGCLHFEVGVCIYNKTCVKI